MSGPGEDEPTGFLPGRWLLGRGWWFLPALLAFSLSLPLVFGERWYTDAPYYQAIATQMVRDGGGAGGWGAWWSPMQGDLPYYNKPPLDFWVHATLVGAFGQHDWTTHGPELVFFMATCVLTAWLARRLHGPVVGVLAGCALALTNEWIWRVSNFKLDSLHVPLMLGALACWVRAFGPDWSSGEAKREPRGNWLGWVIGAGVCIGAALMTKPFYGAGAGAIALVWMWLAGLLNARRAGMVLMSVLIGVLIAAPWHLSMVVSHGHAFMKAYIHEQTLQRALGEMHDRQPWYWYGQLIAGTIGEAMDAWKMWPIYGLALAGLGVVAWRWNGGPMRAGDALAALWTAAWFVALSLFGGKRNYYLMVVHPGTAWLAAIALGACLQSASVGWGAARVRGALRGLAVVGAIVGLALLVRVPHMVHKADRELPVPERDEFMAFVRAQRVAGREIYDCGLSYRIDALTYIQAGYWPRCASERTAFVPDAVHGGELMAYKSDMLAARAFGTYVDPADRLVFRSTPGGQYMVYERHTPRNQP